MTSLQFLIPIGLACALFGSTSGFVWSQPSAPKKYSPEDLIAKVNTKRADPVIIDAMKPDPNDSPLHPRKERCRERDRYWNKIQTLAEIGKWNPQDFGIILTVSAQLGENLLELMEKDADKIKCYELRIAFLEATEWFLYSRVQVGSDPSQNLNIARAARLEAEIELQKFMTARNLPWQRPKPPTPDKDEQDEKKLLSDPFITDAIKPDPNDSSLRKLQKELCREQAVYQAKLETLIAMGKYNPQDFTDFSNDTKKLAANLREVVASPADKLKCYEMGFDAMKLNELFAEGRAYSGSEGRQILNIGRALRIDAEIELFKFKTAMRMPIEKAKISAKAAKEFHVDPDPLKLDPIFAKAIEPDYTLKALQKEGCRERALALATTESFIAMGKYNPQDFQNSRMLGATLSENLLDLFEKPEDKLKCYTLRLNFLKDGEKFFSIRVEAGSEPSQSLELARASRINAEIELLRFKAEIDKQKK